jgi:hypothetical protein
MHNLIKKVKILIKSLKKINLLNFKTVYNIKINHIINKDIQIKKIIFKIIKFKLIIIIYKKIKIRGYIYSNKMLKKIFKLL